MDRRQFIHSGITAAAATAAMAEADTTTAQEKRPMSEPVKKAF